MRAPLSQSEGYGREYPAFTLAQHVERQHLPFFTLQGAAYADEILSVLHNGAVNRTVASRAQHVAWKVRQGELPGVAVVGLPDASTTIGEALTAAGLAGLDTDTRGVLALPVYAFPQSDRAELSAALPVV